MLAARRQPLSCRKRCPDFENTLSVGDGQDLGGKIGVSTRVLFLLSTEQRAVRGRRWDRDQQPVTDGPPMAEWLPDGVPSMPAEAARTELARRWLGRVRSGTTDDCEVVDRLDGGPDESGARGHQRGRGRAGRRHRLVSSQG